MAALAAMGHQMPNSSNPGGGGGGFPQMPQNLTREQLANLLAQQPNQQLQQHLIQQQLLQQQANHVQQQQQQHLNAGHGQEAFPSGGISGAQAALAASQAAAMNRVGTTPGPSSQGQQQQPRPPVAHNASSAKMLQQFPDEVKELAANITDQQLTQWVDKAKRGEFSDHQKAQVSTTAKEQSERTSSGFDQSIDQVFLVGHWRPLEAHISSHSRLAFSLAATNDSTVATSCPFPSDWG